MLEAIWGGNYVHTGKTRPSFLRKEYTSKQEGNLGIALGFIFLFGLFKDYVYKYILIYL